MIDGDDCGAVGGIIEWQEKWKYSGNACPNAALSSTDPIGIEPASNPGRGSMKTSD
jgi:hypothetical protein